MSPEPHVEILVLRPLFREHTLDLVRALARAGMLVASAERASDEVPFTGCCIGHGGHPIYIQDIWRRVADDQPSVYYAEARWVDDSFRLPDGSAAPNLANNGFARVVLTPARVELELVDWYGHLLHSAAI